jgi:hypothetical protein
MATYKVWLTVKDRYGNTKELDGGTIDVALEALSENAVKTLDRHFATDQALAEAAHETILYAGFELEADNE